MSSLAMPILQAAVTQEEWEERDLDSVANYARSALVWEKQFCTDHFEKWSRFDPRYGSIDQGSSMWPHDKFRLAI